MQLRLSTDSNFRLASTTTWERGFSKHNCMKSDRSSRVKLETLDAFIDANVIGQSSDGKYGLG